MNNSVLTQTLFPAAVIHNFAIQIKNVINTELSEICNEWIMTNIMVKSQSEMLQNSSTVGKWNYFISCSLGDVYYSDIYVDENFNYGQGIKKQRLYYIDGISFIDDTCQQIFNTYEFITLWLSFHNGPSVVDTHKDSSAVGMRYVQFIENTSSNPFLYYEEIIKNPEQSILFDPKYPHGINVDAGTNTILLMGDCKQYTITDIMQSAIWQSCIIN